MVGERRQEITQDSRIHYRTSGLSEWRTLIDEVFVHFDFDAPDPSRFAGTCTRFALGEVELLQIAGSAHSLKRGARHLIHGEAPRTLVTLHEYGQCEMRLGDAVTIPQPGDAFVLHSTRPFELHFGSAMKVWVVSIPAQFLGHELLSSERLVGVAMRGDTGISAIAWQLVTAVAENYDELSRAETDQLGTLLLGALNILASAMLEQSGRGLLDTRAYQVERVHRYVRENLRDPGLSPRDVASTLGVSQRYMNKLFETEGTTVGRLILEQRLEGARRDLVNPIKRSKPVSEIAGDWGFNSMSHFSRVFRRQFGASPREVRAGSQHE